MKSPADSKEPSLKSNCKGSVWPLRTSASAEPHRRSISISARNGGTSIREYDTQPRDRLRVVSYNHPYRRHLFLRQFLRP